MFYLTFLIARQGLGSLDCPFKSNLPWTSRCHPESPEISTVAAAAPIHSCCSDWRNKSLIASAQQWLFPSITNMHVSVCLQGHPAPGLSDLPKPVSYCFPHVSHWLWYVFQLCHGRHPKPLPLSFSKEISFLSSLCLFKPYSYFKTTSFYPEHLWQLQS